MIKDSETLEWAGPLLGFMTPLLIAASLSALLLTNTALPSWRVSWVNKAFASLRQFKALDDAEYGAAIARKNQFGVGEPNFNLMAIWLIFLPYFLSCFAYLPEALAAAHEHADEFDPDHDKSDTHLKMEQASYVAGWAGTITLSFFLIPVTRHSVLLVAMNWSPIHALRIHVWAGYLSFFYIFLHGFLLVVTWFMFVDAPIYKEFIPPRGCWKGTFPEDSHCAHQFYNLTGLIDFVFFFVLWASSLNWFRRKRYRLFYLLHVSCGTLALLGAVWHYGFIALYILPSLGYYLASTMPTLVQALASRFRGGVKIVKVVVLEGRADDCLEVHVSTDPTAQAVLATDNHHPSKFVKLCVPKISLVWHPFTVYSHPNDTTTVRILFRAIGPFTKELHSCLTAPERPVTLIDGFYRGSDHCQQAMCHDHVTIVTGGVAISPFFSMIHAVFKVVLAMTGAEEPMPRSMTLIWSCREPGLLSYVRTNYLEDMVHIASGIAGFNFKVKIFYTGKEPMTLTKTLVTLGHDSSTENTSEDASTREMAIEHADKEEELVQEMQPASVDRAHSMELARMLPARYLHVVWNIPYFLAFSGALWLGFHLMFFPFNWAGPSLASMSKQTWITALVVVYFVAVAIIIEAIVLLFRKRWPSPRPDDYEVEVAAVASGDNSEVDTEANGVENKVADVSGCFAVQEGRFGPEDVFADARAAYAPGIFLCGPIPMVAMVRAEARKENSLLGLTRYALYEEAYEM